MVDVVDVVMQNPYSGAMIYASEGTHAQLGWITAKISDIVPIDTALISRNDLYTLPNIFDPNAVHVSPEARARSIMSEAIAGTDIESGLKLSYLTALNPHMDGVSHLQATVDLYVASITESAKNMHSASALALDLDFDGIRDIAFIITPDLQGTPEYFISSLTGVPQSMLSNIPGDTEDYVASILFHESGHVAQDIYMTDHGTTHNYQTNPALFEADADAVMIRTFNKAVAEGYDLNPAVLDVFEEARFASGLKNQGLLAGQHMATALFQMGQEIKPTSHNTGNLVDWENGLPILPSESPLGEIEAAATFQVNVSLGLYHIIELSEQMLGTEAESFNEEQTAILEEKLADMSTDLANTARVGARYGLANPGASLATLEILQEKGYLADANEYVDQVQRFFDNHATDILESEDYQRVKTSFAKHLPPATPMMTTSSSELNHAPKSQEPPSAIASGSDFTNG